MVIDIVKKEIVNGSIPAKTDMSSTYALISNLIKISSISSDDKSEGLDIAAKFVQKWLKSHSLNAKIIEFKKGYPVVVAEIGKGKRTILLNGHVDVVPHGDKSKWSSDPFSGRISGNKIYGRGASDMKAGLGVLMNIMAELNGNIDYKLIFTCVSDEETGGFNCSKYLAEKYNPDLVLVAEPTGPRLIGVGEKGVLHIKVITNGKSAHSSIPSSGSNAIMLMLEDLRKLSKISSIKIKTPQKTKLILNNSATVFGNDLRIVTSNAAVIYGGTKANMVPDLCEADVDIRIPPGTSSRETLKMVKSLVKNGKVVLCPSSEPNLTDINNSQVLSFKKSAESMVGSTKFVISPGASDGRFFRYKNVPTIVYGPGGYKTAHSYNECVDLREIKSIYAVYKDFLFNLCK